jgi:hypothetical protein
MRNQKLIAAIRAELDQIEQVVGRGSGLHLNANGNIVVYAWNPGADVRSSMALISALADRYDLGILAAKSAFQSTCQGESALRLSGFTMIGASVTLAATGRAGPPNYITFMRNPKGAPLFSHVLVEKEQGAKRHAYRSSSERRSERCGPN